MTANERKAVQGDFVQMGTLAAALGPDICGIVVVMYLHHSIGGKSIIGRQIDGLITPSFRDGVIVNPNLIQEIDGGGLFDDSKEAIFPFIVVFATVEEDLCFSTNLSSMDADLHHFLGRAFGPKNPSPGASFFQRLLVPVQALHDLYGPVSIG